MPAEVLRTAALYNDGQAQFAGKRAVQGSMPLADKSCVDWCQRADFVRDPATGLVVARHDNTERLVLFYETKDGAARRRAGPTTPGFLEDRSGSVPTYGVYGGTAGESLAGLTSKVYPIGVYLVHALSEVRVEDCRYAGRDIGDPQYFNRHGRAHVLHAAARDSDEVLANAMGDAHIALTDPFAKDGLPMEQSKQPYPLTRVLLHPAVPLEPLANYNPVMLDEQPVS